MTIKGWVGRKKMERAQGLRPLLCSDRVPQVGDTIRNPSALGSSQGLLLTQAIATHFWRVMPVGGDASSIRTLRLGQIQNFEYVARLDAGPLARVCK